MPSSTGAANDITLLICDTPDLPGPVILEGQSNASLVSVNFQICGWLLHQGGRFSAFCISVYFVQRVKVYVTIKYISDSAHYYVMSCIQTAKGSVIATMLYIPSHYQVG